MSKYFQSVLFLFLIWISIDLTLLAQQGVWVQQHNPGNWEKVFAVNSQKVWVVGDDQVGSQGDIIYSSNGGNSWVVQDDGVDEYLFSVFFIDENIGWVGGAEGVLLKTTNGGVNWIPVSTNSTTRFYDIYFYSELIGWAAGGQWNGIGTYEERIFKTTDGGISWIAQLSSTKPPIRGLFFFDENIGYAVGNQNTVYKTTNGGNPWLPISNQINFHPESIFFQNLNTGWVTAGSKLYKTTDGGNSWVVNLDNNGSKTDIVINENNEGWITAWSGFSYYSNNGGNDWVRFLDFGLDYMEDLHFVNYYTGWAVGDHIYKYIGIPPVVNLVKPDGGENWTIGEVDTITWTSNAVTNVDIYYSTNGGTSWSAIVTNYPNSNHYYWEVPSPSSDSCLIKIVNTSDPNIFDVSNNYFSITEGILVLYEPNGNEQWRVNNYYEIIWSAANVNTVNLSYSTNNGVLWINIEQNVNPQDSIYSWLIPNNPSEECKIKIIDPLNQLLVDISDSVFTIYLATVNVTAPNGGEIILPNSMYTISWISSNVTNVNLYYSLNNGASWELIDSNIVSTGQYDWSVPDVSTNQGLIKILDSEFPNTYDVSDSTFSITGTTSVNDKLTSIPENFFLQQNYPNPFNPKTTIEFGLPESKILSIKLYNTLGEEVAKLFEGYKKAGYHRITFDGLTLISGIYFYRMQAEGFVQTKKMILIK